MLWAGTRDVITFQGTSVGELEVVFRDSVDDYLEFCAERGEEPDKPFSGRLMVRLPPDLHRELYVEAQEEGKSLNQLIAERLKRAVRRPPTLRPPAPCSLVTDPPAVGSPQEPPP